MRILIQRLVLAATDILLLNAGVLVAFLIRFDGRPPAQLMAMYEQVAVPFTLLSLSGFVIAGLYSSLWRYASVDEIFVVLGGTTASAAILGVLVYVVPAVAHALDWRSLVLIKGFPRSVVILTWLLTTVFVGGLRFSFRYARRLSRITRAGKPAGKQVRTRRVLIVGAGDAGAMVAQEFIRHPEMKCELLGYIDDDPRKQRMRIHGLPVLGTQADLPGIADRLAVDEVIIAMPSVSGRVVRGILDSVRDLRVKMKTLPGIYELLNGSVNVSQIREVQIEDLLGREPVAVDLEQIAGYVRNEKVLVTGAGGSIGSELCRQVARFEPAELVLLDNSENGVFEISLELQRCFPSLRQVPVVGDIRDWKKMEYLFNRHHPQVVFHAAAHKHVPLMEAHPDEAVRTNIFGTRNVAQAALQSGAKRFVLISTDKAVNPMSIMGATKRVAEMVIQALDAERRQRGTSGTRFVAVRFGNVLGSRGSVVPIFKEQIARGGPVTVTHPEMRRYFMTIPEAVQLVIQAGAMGEGGEIFVLDMGEPVRILDLAENLIRLSGFEPGIEISIQVTGPRPGEKLFEELLTSEEGAVATRHERIFVGRIPAVEPAWLDKHLAGLGKLVHPDPDPSQVEAKLRVLIPELCLTLQRGTPPVASELGAATKVASRSGA